VVSEEGRPWIVMELIQGQSLADLLKAEGPLTAQRAAFIGGEVLTALRAAHEVGVLHRDVKPANVLISADGRVVLTDFGIAEMEGSTALTMTGEVVGSPEFLAPERALGKRPGPASDLWSLGILLYAAVEGSSPFRQNTPLSTLRAVVDEELPPARRAGALTPVIEGLLLKDPEGRLDAGQTARDLRLISEGSSHVAGTVHETPSRTAETGAGAQVVTLQPLAEAEAQPAVTHPSSQLTTTRSAADPVAAQPAPMYSTPPEFASVGTPARSTRLSPTLRSRRSTALVAAGAALCALALAGTGYAFVNSDADAQQQNTPGAAVSTPGPNTSQPAEDTAAPATQDGKGDIPAADEVQMKVTGSQTTYSGQCPPSDGKAPTFTATFSVDRLPVQLSYRWVSKDGSITDKEWRTLAFPSGGGRTKQASVSLTTWSKTGTVKSEIGVELNAPHRGRSNMVPLSLTCGAGTTGDKSSRN
jgi:serine/threonine protein kinase